MSAPKVFSHPFPGKLEEVEPWFVRITQQVAQYDSVTQPWWPMQFPQLIVFFFPRLDRYSIPMYTQLLFLRARILHNSHGPAVENKVVSKKKKNQPQFIHVGCRAPYRILCGGKH